MHARSRRTTSPLLALTALLLAGCASTSSSGLPQVVPGQILTGWLTDEDPELEDGRRYVEYGFIGGAGERAVILMRSDDFDAYLFLGRRVDGEWLQVAYDDDGGEGTDARIVHDLEMAGEYVIRATAFNASGRGEFTLSREVRPVPRAVRRTIQMGETAEAELSEDDLAMEGRGFYHDHSFHGRRGGSVRITLRSSDFDAYLYLGRMQGQEFVHFAFDDDSGGGLDSRIDASLPADGEYVIRATSFGSGAVGRYALSLEPGIVAMRICILEGGRLQEVIAEFNPASGDTLVDGRPFGNLHPATVAAGYAAAAPWFVQNAPISLGGRSFVKDGPTRVFRVFELIRAGEYRGVPLFGEALTREHPVVYAPIRPGCEFQPYRHLP